MLFRAKKWHAVLRSYPPPRRTEGSGFETFLEDIPGRKKREIGMLRPPCDSFFSSLKQLLFRSGNENTQFRELKKSIFLFFDIFLNVLKAVTSGYKIAVTSQISILNAENAPMVLQCTGNMPGTTLVTPKQAQGSLQNSKHRQKTQECLYKAQKRFRRPLLVITK